MLYVEEHLYQLHHSVNSHSKCHLHLEQASACQAEMRALRSAYLDTSDGLVGSSDLLWVQANSQVLHANGGTDELEHRLSL